MIRSIRTIALAAVAFQLVAVEAVAKDSRSLQLLESFDPTSGQMPASITVDRAGNLYYSQAELGNIQRRSPDGTTITWGTIPVPALTFGVKVGPDNCVYAATTPVSSVPAAAVWRICAQGQVQQFAALDQNGGPNDLAFDEAGNLYVTDSYLAQIWRITSAGVASVWATSPLFIGDAANPALAGHECGVDGIAFDAGEKNLYLGNLDEGTILRLPFSRGTHGTPVVFASGAALRGVDGLAFDSAGTLYAAVNPQDSLVSIEPCGTVTALFQGGVLDGPASLVFGPNSKDLYVVSSAISRAFGFEAGTPQPSLLEVELTHTGLPLL